MWGPWSAVSHNSTRAERDRLRSVARRCTSTPLLDRKRRTTRLVRAPATRRPHGSPCGRRPPPRQKESGFREEGRQGGPARGGGQVLPRDRRGDGMGEVAHPSRHPSHHRRRQAGGGRRSRPEVHGVLRCDARGARATGGIQGQRGEGDGRVQGDGARRALPRLGQAEAHRDLRSGWRTAPVRGRTR